MSTGILALYKARHFHERIGEFPILIQRFQGNRVFGDGKLFLACYLLKLYLYAADLFDGFMGKLDCFDHKVFRYLFCTTFNHGNALFGT